jgi:hypothetical protein
MPRPSWHAPDASEGAAISTAPSAAVYAVFTGIVVPFAAGVLLELDRQHAVLETRVDLLGIHAHGQRDRAAERTPRTLDRWYFSSFSSFSLCFSPLMVSI